MDKMTVFFSTYTGEIKLVSTGVIDFDIFCNNEADMRSFCERAVVPRNDALMEAHKYIVDLNTRTIILKPTDTPVEIKL